MGYRLLLWAGVAEWVTGYCCELVLQRWVEYCCWQVWKRLDSLVSLQGLKRLDSLVGFAVVEDSGQHC